MAATLKSTMTRGKVGVDQWQAVYVYQVPFSETAAFVELPPDGIPGEIPLVVFPARCA